VARAAQGAAAHRDGLALEPVACLDQPVVRLHVEAVERRDRRRGLLRTLEGGGEHSRHVGVGQRLRDDLGLVAAVLGEVVAGQPAVEDPGGVVHLAVTQQVDDRARAAL
jgi:hypothetical protein